MSNCGEVNLPWTWVSTHGRNVSMSHKRNYTLQQGLVLLLVDERMVAPGMLKDTEEMGAFCWVMKSHPSDVPCDKELVLSGLVSQVYWCYHCSDIVYRLTCDRECHYCRLFEWTPLWCRDGWEKISTQDRYVCSSIQESKCISIVDNNRDVGWFHWRNGVYLYFVLGLGGCSCGMAPSSAAHFSLQKNNLNPPIEYYGFNPNLPGGHYGPPPVIFFNGASIPLKILRSSFMTFSPRVSRTFWYQIYPGGTYGTTFMVQ